MPTQWAKEKRHLIRVILISLKLFFNIFRQLFYLFKYETLHAQATLKYLHHWVMYECNNKFEPDFLKINGVPTPGPCFQEESTDPNYQTKWGEVRQYCSKVSLVWAVGGDLVNVFSYKVFFF